MDKFYRAQTKNISFAEMKNFISADGGDGMGEMGGICACRTVTEMLRNTVLDALEDDDEIIIFKGRELCEIYDGYRVEPVIEVARITIAEFKNDPYSFE